MVRSLLSNYRPTKPVDTEFHPLPLIYSNRRYLAPIYKSFTKHTPTPDTESLHRIIATSSLFRATDTTTDGWRQPSYDGRGPPIPSKIHGVHARAHANHECGTGCTHPRLSPPLRLLHTARNDEEHNRESYSRQTYNRYRMSGDVSVSQHHYNARGYLCLI